MVWRDARTVGLSLAMLLAAGTTAGVFAQGASDYPTRQVTIIVSVA